MAIKKSSNIIILKPFVALFKRFHLTIFFIFVIACLAGAVILIYDVLTKSPDDSAYTSSINAGSIDQATLDHIQSLHTSDNPGTPVQPSAGRINPVNE